MKQNRKFSLTRGEELVKLGKALSSQVRIDILKLLEYQNLNVNEIAERLELPPSSAANHVRILEEAGLLKTSLKPGTRGSMKICSAVGGRISIDLCVSENARKEGRDDLHADRKFCGLSGGAHLWDCGTGRADR